ncbi:MAG: hypothetical protein IT260_01725, partial [Saprospiraceae bacterium]|nr:hypothetical protein [Saprospiraceae bacterium]
MAALKKIWNIFLHLLWVGLLTLLTQVGGLVWLLALLLARPLRRRWPLRGLTALVFVGLYLLSTILVVPPLARLSGRVPLPVFDPILRPESRWFCLLNRTYVRPGLRQALEEVAAQMQDRYPGAVVWYMDANFPFLNGYPLEPHFSHKDGRKIDLSVYWTLAQTGQPLAGNPSPFGYGAFAEPLPGERDYAAECEKKGYWYIGLDGDFAAPFFEEKNYVFDAERTAELARLLAEHPAVGKILLQPHLTLRLSLSHYRKIRFQGCKAARHDDHLH